jgi:hypothetical protein
MKMIKNISWELKDTIFQSLVKLSDSQFFLNWFSQQGELLKLVNDLLQDPEPYVRCEVLHWLKVTLRYIVHMVKFQVASEHKEIWTQFGSFTNLWEKRVPLMIDDEESMVRR